MTMTDRSRDIREPSRDTSRDIRDIPSSAPGGGDGADARADRRRSEAEAQELAEAIWLETGGHINGAELARRCRMKPRWGSKMAARLREKYPELPDRHADDVPSARHDSATSARSNGGEGASRTGAARSVGTGPRAGSARAGASKAKPPARGTAQEGVPTWQRIGTRVAVGVVTAVAALLSYSHIRSLAIAAGNGWEADILPLSLDGLVAACTFTLAGGRGGDRGVRVVAWAGIVVGLVGSVAANVIAVDPSVVDLRVVARVLAAFPPLALAVSAHLLVQSHKKPGKR